MVTTAAESADLLLTGSRVRLGVDTWAEAVAVRAGQIVAVGTRAELEALVGRRTRVVEATGGGLVVPGFQDGHIHAPFAGRDRLRLWLNDLSGRQAYLDAIAQYARTHPEEPWIVGGGWAIFHPTTIKIMTDGVLENHTGALFEPYCGGCGGHGDGASNDNRGLTYVEPELLSAALVELDAAGFQVHMHAIGDRAVHSALNAVAAARSANGPSANRHHIARTARRTGHSTSRRWTS
jgi:predicted amidohydrolase YtcJ